MLTEFVGAGGTYKTCRKRPGHQISFTSSDVDNKVYKLQIAVGTSPMIWATWHFLTKNLRITSAAGAAITSQVGMSLPWFEPDISDLPRLVQKIRTYLVFS